MLHEEDASTDVDSVGEIMGTDNNRGTCLAVIALNHFLQKVLACWVKEVERFVKYENLGRGDECRYDTHLLFVSGREVAYKYFSTKHLTSCKMFKLLGNVINIAVLYPRHTVDKREILLWSEKVYEEAIVDERTCEVFPFFTIVHFHSF